MIAPGTQPAGQQNLLAGVGLVITASAGVTLTGRCPQVPAGGQRSSVAPSAVNRKA